MATHPSSAALLVAFVLLTGCATEQGRFVEPRLDIVPPARDAATLRTTMLRAHNDARGAVGVAPLMWDDALVGSAQRYADEMARTRRFAHAAQPAGAGRQGENLWTGTRGAYRYEEMIAAWVDEARDFVNAPTPGFSRTRRWQDVAHYTQIVWRTTTRVGCAMGANARDEYLVCRYAPAGNVVGQRAF